MAAQALAYTARRFLRIVRVPAEHFSYSISPSRTIATIHFGEAFDNRFNMVIARAAQADWFNSNYGAVETWPEYDASLRTANVIRNCYHNTQLVLESSLLS
jgi:hypothetical protein